MPAITLGLDLGPNSIGWALIDEPNEQIIATGVRVFPEGVDNFDTSKEVSRSEARRIARGMRRQTKRRARRKRKLRDALNSKDMFPADPIGQERLSQLDPYELRARALDEKLSLHEIGRIFLHLAQRRGYLSNSKREGKKTEGKIVLSEINVTASQIKADGSRTLGEFLARKYKAFDHTQREMEDVLPNIKKEELKEKGRVRNRHLYRQMYEHEFAAIWEKQATYYPDLLTDVLCYGSVGRQKYPAKPRSKTDSQSDLELFGIHGLLFFHRSLKPVPKEIIGLCELEPNQRRWPRADRKAQRFRLLQEVNNLRYNDPDTHQERNLDDAQRAVLLPYMETREKATFDDIRKKLGFLKSVRFNLERGKRPSIKGSVTDWMMAKAVGKEWHDRPDAEKDTIIRLLLDDLRDDDSAADRLTSEWGFTEGQADAALSIDFPAGYVHLSLKAIEKLLPHMERGLIYQAEDESNSAVHAAGYTRRDELQRRLFDKLPDPARTRDARIGDIPNPVVKRALVELKKVVNAIIREYGKPNAIHVEMGRDLRTRPKKGTDAYRKYLDRIDDMREREARRDAAKEALHKRGIGFGAGGRNILNVLLWEEQAHECIYCGKSISQDQLFCAEVDVDHILPYSRCLDGSQLNKVVCHRHCNHDKGQETPYEWLAAAAPDRYERVCQQAASLMRRGLMPYTKYRRFLLKELKLDDFIARQLNDTRYIAKMAGEYLRFLFEHDHDVLGLKGQLTAELRHQWGLGTILSELPESPAWQAQSDLRPGEKNRADHRHHAIDAVVVALTNRSRLQKLSRIAKQGGMRETGEILDDPWDNFRDDVVTAIKSINVSHRVQRKVGGGLHDDNPYGPTEIEGEWVKRKPVNELSTNEIEKIRDPGIRKIITDRLRDHGVEFGRGVKVENKIWKQVLSHLRMPSGVPIKKVRVLKSEQTIQPIRESTPDEAFVRPGSNHHLAIFKFKEDGETKWDAVFVTMLEASEKQRRQQRELARRVRNLEKQGLSDSAFRKQKREAMRETALMYPLIERDATKLKGDDRKRIPPDAQFVISLSKGELLLLEIDGEDKLYVYNTAAATTRQMTFYPHTATEHKGKENGKLTKYPDSLAKLNPRKVTVDPLGRIRWAND